MRRDQYDSDLGTVSVTRERDSVMVGSRFCLDITYTVGPKGIALGGAVRFKLPGLLVKPGDSGPVSCSNPEVKWTCSNYLPVVNGKIGYEFFTIDYLFVSIIEGALQEGDSISVNYGGNITLKTGAPRMAQQWAVEAAVDPDGSRSAPGSGFALVSDPPVLTFVADRPHRMEIVVPSYTGVNTGFRTTVRMLDRYNNIVEDYCGSVILEVQSDGESVPLGEHHFAADHKGVLAIEDMVLKAPGLHRIIARDEPLGIVARSNPTKTTPAGEETGLFWGDTHCHSSISSDSAAISSLIPRPAQDYEYARNRSALDFCMVTDHIENQSEQDWEETRQAAKDANEPGRFVSFSGFEATYLPLRGDGDKNVYFLNDDEKLVNKGKTEDLYQDLKQRKTDCMVIPHLHFPTNWKKHDPAIERVVEVYAHWGCGLSQTSVPPLIPGNPRAGETYLAHALEQGAKLGFIASADHSYGHPGDDFWWELSNHNGGLAAVYSSELTRRGIWDSLYARRCYATTRARILLEFKINGHMMGEEFATSESTREIVVRAYGTSAIAEISIVKNGRTLHRFPGERRLDVELEHRDDQAERETDYYYVHVVQEDGEQAWGSPVWVTRLG